MSQPIELIGIAEVALQGVTQVLDTTLFFPVFGMPFLVLWLMIGGVFFTLRFRFVNFRLFRHGFACAIGRYDGPKDPGEVTHLQALSAAVSATVGLGNIAGVAVAVTMGGAGAILWMVLAGFLGMTLKFTEVTMGLKYRKIDKNGKVSGGAFYYLKDGLAGLGMPKLGKALALVFAVCCLAASFGGGNMFQSNQAVAILADTFGSLKDYAWVAALLFALLVGVILVGGIKRIAAIAEKIVPLMALLYLAGGATILVVNAEQLPSAILEIIHGAFTLESATGGIIGAIIAGFRRAAFSSEAGMGSAPIAHAAAKTKEPVREGCVALIEPFLDTVVICLMTGLLIVTSGAHRVEGVGDGVLMTKVAFETVAPWFPLILTVSVVLFAFSTIMTWSYYGERAWDYLFGSRYIQIYHVLYSAATFIGGIVALNMLVDFSDMLFFTMAIPNLLGLYLLSNELAKDLQTYEQKLAAGRFKRTW